jgi:hypothetical protein
MERASSSSPISPPASERMTAVACSDLRMREVIGRQPEAALALLDDMPLVAFLQLQACQQVFRQDQSDRIAGLSDLNDARRIGSRNGRVYNGLRLALYKPNNTVLRSVRHFGAGLDHQSSAKMASGVRKSV